MMAEGGYTRATVRFIHHRWFITAAAIVLPHGMAFAQDAGTAPTAPAAPVSAGSSATADATPAGGNDIIVTARRVNESLEKVPISVTAFGATQLAERSLTSSTDLQRNVAGLTVRTGQTSNAINFSIRGQSLDLFTGSRPAVLPYINDVQITTYSAASFYDLESIQALKGPQGTLFGRNATGGAVLYETQKPTNDFGGFITGRLGNLQNRELQGAVNLPIVTDKVLLRVAGALQYRDGYQHNVYTDTNHGKISRQSARISLTLKPTETITSTTVGQFTHSGGDNVQLETWSVYACGANNHGIPLTTTAACFYGPALDSTIGVPDAYQQYVNYSVGGRLVHPGAQPGGILEQLAYQKALGPWAVNSYNPSFHHSHDWFITNTTSFDLNDDLTIKNIAGVAEARSRDMYDAQGTGPYYIQGQDSSTPFNYGGTYTGVTNKTFQWSEELQLVGKAFNQSMNYIVGFYAAYQRDYFFAPVSAFEVLPFIPKTISIDQFTNYDKTQAVYAQATQDLSVFGLNGLKLTGGVRYTWEEAKLRQGPISQYAIQANTPINPPDLVEKRNFSNPSWTVGLDYQANRNLLLYVTHRGSWRSGGFSGTGPARNATAAGGGNLFMPETTYDVEVGAKYGGRLGTMPFHMNVALYNQWIKNIQRVVYTIPPANLAIGGQSALASETVNIPSGRVRGIEVDTSITPVPWLEIGGTLAYTDAKFTDGTSVLFGSPITYGPYADTPKWSGTVYGALTIPTPEDFGKVVLRADLYGQTGQYFSNLAATVAPDTQIPGYKLLNMRLDWSNVRGTKLTISPYVKNLLNAVNYSGGISLGAVFGQNGVIPGEPRTYGLEVSLKF